MPIETISATRVTEDTLISRGPVLWFGAVLTPSAANADATLYAAGSPQPERLLLTLKVEPVTTLPVISPEGVFLDEGLYVDVGSNVTEVTVFWSPVSEG